MQRYMKCHGRAKCIITFLSCSQVWFKQGRSCRADPRALDMSMHSGRAVDGCLVHIHGAPAYLGTPLICCRSAPACKSAHVDTVLLACFGLHLLLSNTIHVPRLSRVNVFICSLISFQSTAVPALLWSVPLMAAVVLSVTASATASIWHLTTLR